MHLIDAVSKKFCELTRSSPGFLHFDALGFLRLTNKKNGIFEAVSDMLVSVKNYGGNLFVPTYSYSYTKREVYSVKESSSDLGRISDYLRQTHTNLRTTDAIFSYVAFATNLSNDFFSPKDYETFGDHSLIASVFNNDGYLLAVGDNLHYCTEVHFLEKMLGVPYRFNKVFPGTIRTLNDSLHDQNITYYCRDLAFAEKYNSIVSFERLFSDMKTEGLIEIYTIESAIEIYAVKFQEVYSYLQKKLPFDQLYLQKSRS